MTPTPPKTIDFYFDLSSPYSYLAATQIEAVAARHGATVAWKPVVLGAVFKAANNTIPAASPPKASWMMGDLARWAARYQVPFRFTSHFPLNAMKAHRMIVAADRLGHGGGALGRAFFDALWTQDRNLGSDDELRSIVDRLGLDGTALLAAAETQPIKDGLRANTEEAISRGMFGAPAMMVDGQLYWGNDRLDFVEAALARG